MSITPLYAQSNPIPAPNALYYEFSGNAWKFSVNYERRLEEDVSFRGGLGYYSVGTSDGNTSVYAVPLLLNGFQPFIIGSFQAGIGVTLFTGNDKDYDLAGNTIGTGTTTFFTLSLGYRIQPSDGGILGEIAYTPLVNFNGTYISNWGLGVGLAF
ncbi:MAG TPA: hypothetical protein VFJ29_04025 [Candidatus Kapabacteria bacterium]|nr:hypothetical protein [Candidatus Kapabacteria bacterium]